MNPLKWFRRVRAEQETAPRAPEPQADSAVAEAEQAEPAPPAEAEPAFSAEEEALAKQLKEAADFLAERIDVDVPPTGRGRPVFVRMPIEGTRNSALLIVQPGEKDRAVTLGAMREGYDMQVMNYVFSGGNDEVKAWLRRPETSRELAALVKPLSDRLDEKLEYGE